MNTAEVLVEVPDWGTGIEPDVIARIARMGGFARMKILREVCKTWQLAYERDVINIKIPFDAPPLLSRGIDQRFSSLRSLDAGSSSPAGEAWLKTLKLLPNLRYDLFLHSYASHLSDRDLPSFHVCYL